MTALACPNCGSQAPLKHYTDQEEHAGVHACDTCCGLWFDGHTLHDFMHSRRLQARFLLSDAAEPLESIGYTIDTHPRRCPRCRKGLEEAVYGGVELDLCRTCQGIWFDDGELRRAIDIHTRHRGRLDVVDAELEEPKAEILKTLPHVDSQRLKAATQEAAAVATEKARTLAQRIPEKITAEARHLFEAVAHLLHHDHDGPKS